MPIYFLLTLTILVSYIAYASCHLWMSIDLKKLEFRPCNEAPGCSPIRATQMRIQENMLPFHERRSSSWQFFEATKRSTVSYWMYGTSKDWHVSIQFVANDPVYGFLRICDHSPFVRVFGEKERVEPYELESKEVKTINLIGHCFNATVTIQRDEGVCPWCGVVQSQLKDTVIRSSLSNDTLQRIMFLLGIMSVVASVGTIILIACYLKDRRASKPKIPKTVPIYVCPQMYSGSCRETRTPKRPYDDTKFATIASSRQTYSTSGISSISKFSFSDSLSDISDSCPRSFSPIEDKGYAV